MLVPRLQQIVFDPSSVPSNGILQVEPRSGFRGERPFTGKRGTDQTELSKGDETRVVMRLSTGRGRETAKKSLSATCCFHWTCIAGRSWGVSRDSETLGPVRDFSDLVGRPPRHAISGLAGDANPRKSRNTCTKRARPASSHRQALCGSRRVAEPDQMEAAGIEPASRDVRQRVSAHRRIPRRTQLTAQLPSRPL